MGVANSLRKLVIIPVYGQVGTIGKVLSKFGDPAVDEICLVVDCPTESILREIRVAGREIEIPIRIIQNSRRMGVGYAIREGIEYALSHGFDIIVVMAGNDKDDPREISRLLNPIVKEGYDYVQGSRFLPGGRRIKNPILRGIFSLLYPFIWTLLTSVKCTDVTNGFRAYKTTIFDDENINIWQSWLNGYSLEYYIHYKVLTASYKTKEVPVSKVYPYRHKGGYSMIVPLRDWWDILRPLIYLSLNLKR